jgi:hypothetical protein
MTAIEGLPSTLNALGLKAVEARLEGLVEQASKKEPSYADFLAELLGCEVDARRSRYLRASLQLAHLPFVKTFDQFETPGLEPRSGTRGGDCRGVGPARRGSLPGTPKRRGHGGGSPLHQRSTSSAATSCWPGNCEPSSAPMRRSPWS